MNLDKTGGIALILGSIFFALYSSLFFVLLPIGAGNYDTAAKNSIILSCYLRIKIKFRNNV